MQRMPSPVVAFWAWAGLDWLTERLHRRESGPERSISGGGVIEQMTSHWAARYNACMSATTRTARPAAPTRIYTGADVPMRVIRRFVSQIAERFRPDKIILFGSHAYGTPHADSDVDILVIMPCRNQLDQAVKISLEIDPPFPMDIIVRKPRVLEEFLDDRESFHTDIVSKGRVLYEKQYARVGAQSGRGLRRRPKARTRK